MGVDEIDLLRRDSVSNDLLGTAYHIVSCPELLYKILHGFVGQLRGRKILFSLVAVGGTVGAVLVFVVRGSAGAESKHQAECKQQRCDPCYFHMCVPP